MKMDQKFLIIDFYSWSELSGSLMAESWLKKSKSHAHATAVRGAAVSLI